MPTGRPTSSQGLALLVVVAVLGIAAILALCFITMARLERKASQKRTYATKAYFLARSGIEDAMARLTAGQDPCLRQNRYGGEDADLSGGTLSPAEAVQEIFRPGQADVDACPLPFAQRPSFAALAGVSLLSVPVDGRPRGYSGRLQDDRTSSGNVYSLKLLTGGFYVNGGDPSIPWGGLGDRSYNDTLRRMLGTLAEAIDRDVAGGLIQANDGSPVDQTDGEKLIELRPPGGWQSYEQIRAVCFPTNPMKFHVLRPYLALRAWVDKRVIAPNAIPPAVSKDYHSWGEMKLDRPLNGNAFVPGDRSPDFERIPPGAGGRIVGRAPVSLAWARSRRPALISLLAGLRAVQLDEAESSEAILRHAPAPSADTVAVARNTVAVQNSWSTGDYCHLVADRFLSSTSELSTWQQFNEFCDKLTGLPWRRDAIKANFNPNSDLNKFNPNPSMFKQVDKSDLTVYSTEFSLLPVQPVDVECIGRVLDGNGALLASRTLTAVLPAPSVARLSTQREFICEDLGSLDLPGDERGPRLPGFSIGGHAAFLSQSQGAGVRTWGHRLDTRGVPPAANYATGWMNGASSGSALQSYPEPCYDVTPNLDALLPDPTPTRLDIRPADYDGNLQLATVETADGDCYTVIAPPKRMTFLARFDDGFDLDLADAYPANPRGRQNQPDVQQATYAGASPPDLTQLANSLLHGTRPNTLYPDGCYSERDRSPAYFDRDSIHGFHGLMSFWVKPNHPVQTWRKHQYVHRTNYVANLSQSNSPDQLFWVGNSSASGFRMAACFEIGHLTTDWDPASIVIVEHEFQTPTGRPDAPRRWTLLTFFWDFRSLYNNDRGHVQSAHDSGELLLDGGSGFLDKGSDELYPAGGGILGNAPLAASDITLDDKPDGVTLQPHMISLGRHGKPLEANVGGDCALGADATLDEFAVYDFGGAGPAGIPAATADTLDSPSRLALKRYQEGRYYKEADYRSPGALPLLSPLAEAGSWISAPIRLPTGSLLDKIAWTWIRPAALPSDYVEVELLHPSASTHLWAPSRSRSTQAPSWNRDRQVWDLGRIINGDFRLRVVFRREVPVPANTPILDSPVFDDITLAYTLQGGGSILAWEELK